MRIDPVHVPQRIFAAAMSYSAGTRQLRQNLDAPKLRPWRRSVVYDGRGAFS
jgi:hypothetical protein